MAELVASFFTLTGSGFAEPPRHGVAERCRAAADAGFAGIGLHVADLHDVDAMRAVLDETGLRVVEIEFLGGWALDGPDLCVEEAATQAADAARAVLAAPKNPASRHESVRESARFGARVGTSHPRPQAQT